MVFDNVSYSYNNYGENKIPAWKKYRESFGPMNRSLKDLKEKFDKLHYECLKYDYELVDKMLGTGAYANVYLAHVLPSKYKTTELSKKMKKSKPKLVAIKVIDKMAVPSEFQRSFLPREIENHRKLPFHPNVVQLYDHFSTRDFVYLVLEYCKNGDLLDRINMHIHKRERGLPPTLSRKIFVQLCLAVKHCHDNAIVHRDLKCENILLDLEDNAKLTDFGFSIQVTEESALRTACGSLAYAAPEITDGRYYNGMKADIWSLGVILFAMVNGRLPYPDQKATTKYEDVIDPLKKKELEFEKSVSPECAYIIRAMLNTNADKRPPIKKIIRVKWVREQIKLTSEAYRAAHSKERSGDETSRVDTRINGSGDTKIVVKLPQTRETDNVEKHENIQSESQSRNHSHPRRPRTVATSSMANNRSDPHPSLRAQSSYKPFYKTKNQHLLALKLKGLKRIFVDVPAWISSTIRKDHVGRVDNQEYISRNDDIGRFSKTRNTNKNIVTGGEFYKIDDSNTNARIMQNMGKGYTNRDYILKEKRHEDGVNNVQKRGMFNANAQMKSSHNSRSASASRNKTQNRVLFKGNINEEPRKLTSRDILNYYTNRNSGYKSSKLPHKEGIHHLFK